MSKFLGSAMTHVVTELERKAKAEEYFNDPAAWAEYMLGAYLWSKQRTVCRALINNKSVAVKAGHGVGKSFLAAVLICWWIDTRYPRVYIATTAPSTAQINAIVWREVRRMKSLIEQRHKEGLIDHKLPGYITADAQWKADDGNLLGFGRKPPDNKEDDAFQGLHDGYVLAIGDEACGLSGEIIDALGNITSNANSRRLLIANPTNPASYFASLFKEDKGWDLHTISVLDSPNFTDEKYDMAPEALENLTDVSYVEDKAKEYGRNSARFKARVLGEFAFDSANSLFSPETVDQAIAADIEDPESRPVLGVDVARFGEDRTVVYMNQGGRIRFVDAWSKASTVESASRVHRLMMETGAWLAWIDSDGVGGGVKDQLVLLANGLYQVGEVHGSGSSPDRRQWHNLRAYLWDNLRKRCLAGDIDLDPGDTEMHDELLSVQYGFNKQSGGLQVESKTDMKARGMRSPDLADAVIYASIEYDTEDPLNGFAPGDKIRQSASDVLGDDKPSYLELMTLF